MAYEAQKKQSYGQYQYGTAAPVRTPEKERRERQEDDREYLKKARLVVKEKQKTKTREARALSLIQSLVLSAALFALAGLSFLYLGELSVNYETKTAAAETSRTLEELHQENLLLENEEDSRIDYDSVYTYATETLGMQIPEKQQVLYYAGGESEYVTLEAAIPHE